MAGDPSDLKSVGRRMALLALALRFRHQKELAEELGCSKSRWSNYTTGVIRPPFHIKDALRRKFQVDPSWIDYGTRAGMPEGLLAEIDRLSAPQANSKPRQGAKRL